MYKTIRFWTALGVYLYKALFSAGVKRFLSEIAIFSMAKEIFKFDSFQSKM